MSFCVPQPYAMLPQDSIHKWFERALGSDYVHRYGRCASVSGSWS